MVGAKIEKHPFVDKQYNIKFIDNNNVDIVISWARNSLNGDWMVWTNQKVGMWTTTKSKMNILVKDIKNTYGNVEEITL